MLCSCADSSTPILPLTTLVAQLHAAAAWRGRVLSMVACVWAAAGWRAGQRGHLNPLAVSCAHQLPRVQPLMQEFPPKKREGSANGAGHGHAARAAPSGVPLSPEAIWDTDRC